MKSMGTAGAVKFWENRAFVMVGISLFTDLMLFLILGCLALNGMEFTGLKTAVYNAIANAPNDEEMKHLIQLRDAMPAVRFSKWDYLKYCTLPCMFEDLVITLIYFGLSDKNVLKRTECVFFCLAHVVVKILLNAHATGMFLGALEYSREFSWTAINFSNKPENIRDLELTGYFLPDKWWLEQITSLSLALCVLCLTLALLLMLVHQKCSKHPYWIGFGFLFDITLFVFLSTNSQAAAYKLPLVIFLAIVLLAGIIARSYTELLNKGVSTLKGWMDKVWNCLGYPAGEGKTDLYRWPLYGTALFALFTIIWVTLVVAMDKENYNSLYGFQYSAILKLLTPLCMSINLLFSQMEEKRPERYKQHNPNVYLFHTLMFILGGCAVLAFLGEFGSIICILALTILMFFLSGTASAKNPLSIRKLIKSILTGTLIGVVFIAVENGFFQLLARLCGFEMEGAVNGFRLDAVMAGIACVLGVIILVGVIFYCMGIVLRLDEKFSKQFLQRIRNKKHKLSGRFNQKMNRASTVGEKNVSISIILIPIVALVIGYNFFFNWYSGTTVLRSYYLKAGDFSTEFEIAENITESRINEVAYILKDEKPAVSEEIKVQLELISSQVNPDKKIVDYQKSEDTVKALNDLNYHYKAYRSPYSKVMSIIERLCFSSHTEELSRVQSGLKQNMGFSTDEIKENRTYISTLQSTRQYVTPADVNDPAQSSLYSMYFREDGLLRENLYLLDENGDEPDKGDNKFIWYNTEEEVVPHFVFYEDDSREEFDVKVLQKERIFKYASPGTAVSDYMLYTLSRIGVGNVLLLIFMPFFVMLVLIVITNAKIQRNDDSLIGGVRFVLHHIGVLYAVSFVIQTIVILLGVFGISLFSGLSLPLIAAGDCEMMLNNMCVATIFFAVGDNAKNVGTNE